MSKNKKKYKKFTDKQIVDAFVTEIIEPYMQERDENITIDHLIKGLTAIGKINKDVRDSKYKNRILSLKTPDDVDEIERITDGDDD